MLVAGLLFGIEAGAAIVVDGALDEPEWKSAEWHADFRRIGDDAAKGPPTRGTSFAVVSDERNLYIGVRCKEKDVGRLRTGEDLSLWKADSVELFLAPDGSNFSFYQFAASPVSKSVYANFYSEGGEITPDPFAPKWNPAFALGDGEWTAEFHIPLSAFYMTRNADWRTEWLVNVSRTSLNPREEVVWAPIDHFPRRESKKFRKLGGFPMRKRGEDFAVQTVFPELSGRRNGVIEGELALVVYAADGGDYEVSTSAGGLSRKVTLRPGENRLKVPCRYQDNGFNQTHITFVRTTDGEAFERDYPVRVDFQPIRVKLTIPQYRNNFYPGQSTDRVCGTAEILGGGEATVTLEGPGFPVRTAKVSGKGEFAFDTKGFAVGDAFLTVRTATNEKKVRIRNLPPTGRQMVWIEDGHLVVNGKPVFRRNIGVEYWRGGKKLNEKYDAEIAEFHQTLDLRQRVSLEPFRLHPSGRAIERKEAIYDVKPCDYLFRKIDEVVAKAQKTDFAAYNLTDEPECRGLSPVYLKYIYDYVAEKDPYHPIWSDSRGGRTYVDCVDWFQTHPYLSCRKQPTGERTYGVHPNRLGDYIDAFGLEGRPDKCVGSVPTCFAYRYQSIMEDYPTFDEYMLNCWVHLMRGAKTIDPYAYHDMGDRPQLYIGTKYIFESIEALEDLLLRAKRTPLARTPEWEAGTLDVPDDGIFILVNYCQTNVTVRLDGLKSGYREFRGERTFGPGEIRLTLHPHETVVATVRPHDKGLRPLAEVAAEVAAAEKARLSRDNQLLERYENVVMDTNITPAHGSDCLYKLIDGMYDQLAYFGSRKDAYFVEFAFPKFTPAFSKIRIHGSGLFDAAEVSVRQKGEWRALKPVGRKCEKYFLELDFGETIETVKMRIVFPGTEKGANEIELYEIELPRAPGGSARTAVRAVPVADAGVKWRLTGKDALPSLTDSRAHWQVKRLEKSNPPDPLTTIRPFGADGFTIDGFAARDMEADPACRWLVLDIAGFRDQPGNPYRSWVTFFGKEMVCGIDTYPQPGVYTIRLDPQEGIRNLRFYVYGLVADFNSVSLMSEPANRIELAWTKGKDVIEPGDSIGVRVRLAEPCADVAAEFLYMNHKINGLRAFNVNGAHGIELKALDDTGRLWGAAIKVKSCGKEERRGVYVRAQALGSPFQRPLYANFSVPFSDTCTM